jgi:hypothetical protein
MTSPTPADAGTTPAEPVAAPVEPTTPTAPSPANMPQQVTPPAQEASGPDDGDQPDPAKAETDRLKREAQNQRARRREAEQAAEQAKQVADQLAAKVAEFEDWRNKIAAVFNPEADKPLTAEELAAQFADERAQWESKSTEYDSKLAEYDAKVRDLTIRAALPSVLSKAQADPGLTEAVLTASGALAKLDPTSETFAADLESAVASAVEQNPRLKVAPVATRSGAPIPGRSGGDGQLTREDVQKMAKSDPEGLVKAQKDGRLRHLGIS